MRSQQRDKVTTVAAQAQFPQWIRPVVQLSFQATALLSQHLERVRLHFEVPGGTADIVLAGASDSPMSPSTPVVSQSSGE